MTMTGDASLLPAPLREVWAWEGLDVPAGLAVLMRAHGRVAERATPDQPGRADTPRVLRWELFGLPGFGKSTLSRGLVDALSSHAHALLLPEAVPYAVVVRGIELKDLEPFLDDTNSQAEAVTRAAADAVLRHPATAPTVRPLVVIRDPAWLQNESYRFVLHALRDPTDPAAVALAQLGRAAAAGEWREDLAQLVGRTLWGRHPALCTPPGGRWRLGHVLLTTGDAVEDFRLSLARQRDGRRDPRLVTDAPEALAGYLATLRFVERESRTETGAPLMQLDPRATPESLVETVSSATIRYLSA